MKYSRLTKEQLDELHKEFITFLSTQGIDDKEWKTIKKVKPEVAEQELDVFSDLVWEKVLGKVRYLEHFSPQQIFLFKVEEFLIQLIGVKIDNETINLSTRAGYKWLQNHLLDKSISFYKSTKKISKERNTDIFALIKQGANITKGELFEYFSEIVNHE